MESVKAASDIYAPISGVIHEINETLNDKPGLLNKSPEKDGELCRSMQQASSDVLPGWLCRIKVEDGKELEVRYSIPALYIY